jgi:hypothetical protein
MPFRAWASSFWITDTAPPPAWAWPECAWPCAQPALDRLGQRRSRRRGQNRNDLRGETRQQGEELLPLSTAVPGRPESRPRPRPRLTPRPPRAARKPSLSRSRTRSPHPPVGRVPRHWLRRTPSPDSEESVPTSACPSADSPLGSLIPLTSRPFLYRFRRRSAPRGLVRPLRLLAGRVTASREHGTCGHDCSFPFAGRSASQAAAGADSIGPPGPSRPSRPALSPVPNLGVPPVIGRGSEVLDPATTGCIHSGPDVLPGWAYWCNCGCGTFAGFAAFVATFAARFPVVESRRQMRVYVRGLLGEAAARTAGRWRAAGDPGPETDAAPVELLRLGRRRRA